MKTRLPKALRMALAAIGLAVCVALVAVSAYAWISIVQAKARQTLDRAASSPKGGEYAYADDASLFVQRLGKPDAPAVVFIHGTGSWSETWRPSMVAAQALGYQAIAVDMPPFGYSVPPLSSDYSKPKQAARLLTALDSLGIRRAVFVAHSFGAAPVMEALIAHPERASALVLVDAALGLDSPQTDGSDNALQRLLRRKWLARSISAAYLTNPERTEGLLRNFISEKDKATPEWVRLYRQPLSLAGSYENVADWLPELVSSRGRQRSDDPAEYAKLPWPVTLIWGETDTITPLSQAENLRQRIPGARLIRIPAAGHIPQMEEPEQFRAALQAALGRR
jgi:pimeloyl-ACP methyl ester carboxylesterase